MGSEELKISPIDANGADEVETPMKQALIKAGAVVVHEMPAPQVSSKNFSCVSAIRAYAWALNSRK